MTTEGKSQSRLKVGDIIRFTSAGNSEYSIEILEVPEEGWPRGRVVSVEGGDAWDDQGYHYNQTGVVFYDPKGHIAMVLNNGRGFSYSTSVTVEKAGGKSLEA